MDDPHDLARFVTAQASRHADVVDELRRGRKSGHWIWYVFPQVAGLGLSHMSRRYSIASLDEARAYLAHPVLGPRLEECVGLLLSHDDRSAEQMLGGLDAMKLRSCLTLFDLAGGGPVFRQALTRYFAGRPDERTLDLLGRG